MHRRVGALGKQALAVVLGRKAVSEPFRETLSCPAVKMKDGTLGHGLADAVPVERRLAANMQPLELSLQQRDCHRHCETDPGRRDESDPPS